MLSVSAAYREADGGLFYLCPFVDMESQRTLGFGVPKNMRDSRGSWAARPDGLGGKKEKDVGFTVPAGRARAVARFGGAATLAVLLVAPVFGAVPLADAQSRQGRALELGENSAPITVQDGTGADPYPSTLQISGVPGRISDIRLRLIGVTHTFEDDLDVMLVSPDGQAVLVLSDAGGENNADNLSVTFDNTSTTLAPDEDPIGPAAYDATDFDTTAGDSDSFGATAPTPNGDSMDDFLGESANGRWRLFVRDDTTNDFSGEISGGWLLRIETTNSPPIANTDIFETPSGKRLIVKAVDGILKNDRDPDGEDDFIRAIPFEKASAKGRIIVSKRGAVDYKPKAGAAGRDVFAYEIKDSKGARDTGTIIIRIGE